MADIFDMVDTWNDGATTFTAIKMNATDTASAAGSLLMDLQVGGASKFSVRKNGRVDAAEIVLSGSARSIWLLETGYLQFGTSADLQIHRDAADTLAQRRSTNAQTFRLCNTYTDASNYERGFMRWNSNVLQIGAEAAGTGAQREFSIVRGTTTYLTTTSTALSVTVNANFAGDITMAATDPFTFSGRSKISSPADGVVRISANTAANGAAHELLEMTAPAAGAANTVRIYAEDDGAGKTRLMALFATGAAQQIAIEP